MSPTATREWTFTYRKAEIPKACCRATLHARMAERYQAGHGRPQEGARVSCESADCDQVLVFRYGSWGRP